MTDEAIAHDVREAVDGLNGLLLKAARAGLCSEVEVDQRRASEHIEHGRGAPTAVVSVRLMRELP